MRKFVEELESKNTQKLSKDEQFRFLDGYLGFAKIKSILKSENVDLAALNYFIDIEPDQYLEHLKKFNPPNRIQEDIDSESIIAKSDSSYKLSYYLKGGKVSERTFESYEDLLKFIVSDRLSKIGYKYKAIFSSSLYKNWK